MKFLIINPFGIGDVLFTTPLIRAIKEADPGHTVSYWCNLRVEEIFSHNPEIKKVFALSRGDLKKIFQASFFSGIKAFFGLLKSLKKERFDAVFDFSLDQRYGFICWLLGIKKRIGFNYKNRGLFLTNKIELKGYASRHVVEEYLGLLKFIEIKANNPKLEVFATASDYQRVKFILQQSGITDNDTLIGIVAGAGASWGKTANLKHWQPIKYGQLADKISDSYNVKILLLGDESEKPISEVVYSSMRNKPVDLTGRLSIGELIALIARLKILISNDGGPMHLAVALGVKTISIFGPVDEKVYGPYPGSENNLVIKKELTCRPCYQNFRIQNCAHERACMNLITVDEVFQAVRSKM